MSKWQPIETAPKDGTEILGAYVYHYRKWDLPDYSIIKWIGDGWTGMCGGSYFIDDSVPYCNYWMPLPEPPEED